MGWGSGSGGEGFAFGAIGHGVFFDVEADFGPGWRRRGLQQRAQLLEDFAQRDVVDQQGFVYFREAPEKGGMGGDVLTHFDQGANAKGGPSLNARCWTLDAGWRSKTGSAQRVGCERS